MFRHYKTLPVRAKISGDGDGRDGIHQEYTNLCSASIGDGDGDGDGDGRPMKHFGLVKKVMFVMLLGKIATLIVFGRQVLSILILVLVVFIIGTLAIAQTMVVMAMAMVAVIGMEIVIVMAMVMVMVMVREFLHYPHLGTWRHIYGTHRQLWCKHHCR